MITLKSNYEDLCNAYLRTFCKKHSLGIADAFWVGGRVGEVATIGDYNVDMATMRDDLDNDVPEDEFFRYYDYCQEVSEFGITVPNYHSWIKGCPRVPSDVIERLRALHTEIDNLTKEYNCNTNLY